MLLTQKPTLRSAGFFVFIVRVVACLFAGSALPSLFTLVRLAGETWVPTLEASSAQVERP
jgi:hypothetical protein